MQTDIHHSTVTIDGEFWFIVGWTHSPSRGPEYTLSRERNGQPYRVCYKPANIGPCTVYTNGKQHIYE